MTTETAHPGGDPHQLLSNARELAQRVRRDQRATWFPLLVLAVLTAASIPVRRYSGHHLDCSIALVLAYAAIAPFYIRRSRARGVGTRVRSYAIAGIIVAVALTGAALWELHDPALEDPLGLNGLPYRLASPGAAIGLGLLVLAWAERNRPLFLLTLVYLAAVLVPITFGRVQFDPPWYSSPAISQCAVLLLGGIGFAVAQRPLRSPAP